MKTFLRRIFKHLLPYLLPRCSAKHYDTHHCYVGYSNICSQANNILVICLIICSQAAAQSTTRKQPLYYERYSNICSQTAPVSKLHEFSSPWANALVQVRGHYRTQTKLFSQLKRFLSQKNNINTSLPCSLVAPLSPPSCTVALSHRRFTIKVPLRASSSTRE